MADVLVIGRVGNGREMDGILTDDGETEDGLGVGVEIEGLLGDSLMEDWKIVRVVPLWEELLDFETTEDDGVVKEL